MIEAARLRRQEKQASWRDEREQLAHTAREIAKHLEWLAVQVQHYPCDDEERDEYRGLVATLDGLTKGRAPLPPPKVKREGEPFSLEELQVGWVNPLGSLWAAWTQAFNLREFSHDREAMLAVTRTLKALSYAFWPHSEAVRQEDHRRVDSPENRDARCTNALADLGRRSREFLGDDDVVEERPELADALLRMFFDTMRKPYFVFESPDPEKLLTLREVPPDAEKVREFEAELNRVADQLAESLLETLRCGYSFSEMRAELPPDFDSPERASKLRKELRRRIQLGEFDPGSIDREAGLDYFGGPLKDAAAALRESLRILGYPEKRAKSLFRAHQMRKAKATESE